ncbi:hypothetical protein PybrP1_006840 [[Pythium] brassicae (nom. inval.)]|nr:hypothetical protein PybrP1_006840 [[Pythium] brassicae (nom. inval.)]
MSVFVIFALLLALAVAIKKRWLRVPARLLRSQASKQDPNADSVKLEIVVDKAPPARKSLFSKPPRHEGPANASSGSAEPSIRTALNELRSRQVVKSLCSKFEARVARHSVVVSADDDEEACIRAAHDGGDEYLQSEQSQLLRREEPRAVPAPYMHRRGSNSGTGLKPNNLNAFLRRCSSNMDRMNTATDSDASATISSPEAAPALETVVPTPATLMPPTSTSVPAPVFIPRPVVADIETLDLQVPCAVGESDEDSNQCDSPVRLEPLSLLFLGSEPAHDELSGGDHTSDWDVTLASKQPQSPEESALEDKPVRPVVHNSVARFRQFQLQIPPNHARSTTSSQ